MDTNCYFFKCTGGFDINSKLTTHMSWDGEIVSFNLPDGSTADLFVGLRVVNPDGQEKYIHSVEDFEQIGFFGMDYDELIFFPENNENPNEND